MQKIRMLKKSDKEKINELFCVEKTVLLWDFDLFFKHPDCFGVILEVGSRVVGFGALIRYISPRHGGVGRFEDIFVHPDFRGGGLGKLIIDELIKLGEKIRLNQIILTSNSRRKVARHIYESRGFFFFETGVGVKELKVENK